MKLTINELSTKLEEAYISLKIATRAVHIRTEEHAKAQRALTEARQAIIAKHADDPKALGNNETARNARVEEMTAEERAAVREAEDALRRERDHLEIVRIEVEGLRAQLRCHEVAASLTVNGGVR